MKEKDGGPAFPATVYVEPSPYKPGMSLRDYFAGQALQLMGQARGVAIFQTGEDNTVEFVSPENIARQVYILADAMLLEREKT